MTFHQPETTTTLIHKIKRDLFTLEKMVLDNTIDSDGGTDVQSVSAQIKTDVTTLDDAIQGLNPETDNTTADLD